MSPVHIHISSFVFALLLLVDWEIASASDSDVGWCRVQLASQMASSSSSGSGVGCAAGSFRCVVAALLFRCAPSVIVSVRDEEGRPTGKMNCLSLLVFSSVSR